MEVDTAGGMAEATGVAAITGVAAGTREAAPTSVGFIVAAV
jgi:hypothetical protein